MSSGAKRFAVFGNPIAHSRSPEIHAQFAAQFDLAIDYRRQLVDTGEFATAAREFFAAGGAGLNITLPFKLDACAFADELSERAKLAGAVNTLIPREGKIIGDNTDGIGIVRDIVDNQGWQLRGKRLLVIGAGGAVRGVLGPLLEQLPARLVLHNRTAAKAAGLIELFAPLAEPGQMQLFDAGDNAQRFDVVINGTSAAVHGQSFSLPAEIAEQARCYDMMYAAADTPFMQWAQQHGAVASCDGLGMLVEQAAESFALWLGKRPATAPVITWTRDQLVLDA